MYSSWSTKSRCISSELSLYSINQSGDSHIEKQQIHLHSTFHALYLNEFQLDQKYKY